MPSNFHETYDTGEIKPPSERSTGLAFAAIALVVATWWRHSPVVPWVALALAAALAVLSLGTPSVLRPLNLVWFRIGQLLHRVVNPLVMLVMFAVVFVPAGLIMRIRHDPLGSRRAAPGASYWIDRSRSEHSPGSMDHQF